MANTALPCPICESSLTMIGRRARGIILANGAKQCVRIRRLRCTNAKCGKIHHEIPDVIVPYKRHCAETIERIVSGEPDDVPCEASTINRIRAWWSAMSSYFKAILRAIAARLDVEPPPNPTFPELVRAAANSHSWTFPGNLSGVPPGVTFQPVRQ